MSFLPFRLLCNHYKETCTNIKTILTTVGYCEVPVESVCRIKKLSHQDLKQSTRSTVVSCVSRITAPETKNVVQQPLIELKKKSFAFSTTYKSRALEKFSYSLKCKWFQILLLHGKLPRKVPQNEFRKSKSRGVDRFQDQRHI